ncbi:MAG: extracellular solute-binding protein, partial [Oscillospiraceae bacterium]|nr:extracellular solute-binding protein [Oscillospiraceae bacterium]
SAAVMYTSQGTAAMLADPSLEVVYPSEGLGFGIMAAFIPSNAPNAEAAHKFLDYLLDAEQSARCFEYLGYYSTNAAADPLIAEEFRGFLTLPAGIGGNMEMIQNISPDSEELHSRIWTEFLLKTE